MRDHYFGRRLRVEPLEDRRMLAVLTVNTNSDDWNTTVGDEFLTLREAITVVNAGTKTGIIPVLGRELSEAEKNLVDISVDTLGESDLIIFSGVTSPIQLQNVSGSNFGELGIQKSVTVDGGDGMNAVTVRAFNPTLGTPIDNNFANDEDGGRVLSISGTGVIVQLLDMTLTGGDVQFGQGGGGAIRVTNSSLRLERIHITGNSTPNNEGGGGIYAQTNESSILQIVDSIIASNYTTGSAGGGGIRISGQAGLTGDLHVENSIIDGNFSRSNGGGISAFEVNKVHILRSILSNNEAGYGNYTGLDWDEGSPAVNGNGGGVYVHNLGEFLFAQNSVQQNRARYSGGGLYNHAAVSNQIVSNDIIDSLFAANVSGIQHQLNNANGVTFNGGGGAFIQSSLEVNETPTNVVNCTFSNNRSLNGGGLFLQGNIQIKHTTIAFNEAGPFTLLEGPYQNQLAYTAGGGVAIHTDLDFTEIPSDPVFSHSIIANNSHVANEPNSPNDPHNYSPNVGFLFHIASGGAGESPQSASHFYEGYTLEGLDFRVPEEPFKAMQFEYTMVNDLAGPLGIAYRDLVTIADSPGPEIIIGNPLLGELQDNGGFELPDGSRILTHALLAGSPAIDAGDPDFTGDPEYDQRGIPFDRVYTTRIDIGAYEKQPIAFGFCDADFDRDGDVDGRDFLVWQRGFGTSDPSHQDGDANFNGIVDGTDLACWQEHYGTGATPLADVTSAEDTALATFSRSENLAVDDWYKLNGLAMATFPSQISDWDIPEQDAFFSESASDYSAVDLIGVLGERRLQKQQFNSMRLWPTEEEHSWTEIEIGAVEAVFAELL